MCSIIFSIIIYSVLLLLLNSVLFSSQFAITGYFLKNLFLTLLTDYHHFMDEIQHFGKKKSFPFLCGTQELINFSYLKKQSPKSTF